MSIRQFLAVGWARRVLTFGCLVLLIPAMAMFVETVARGSFAESARWVTESPAAAGLTVLLIASLLLPVACLAGLRVGGWSVLLLLALLAAVHATKMLIVGQPLFPWDIVFVRQGADVFPKGYFPHTWLHVLCFVGMVAVLAALIRPLPRLRWRWPWRVLLCAPCLLLLGSVVFYRQTPAGKYIGESSSGVIPNLYWNQPDSYRVNGLVLSFLMNTAPAIAPAPPGYGPRQVRGLVQSLAQEAQPVTADMEPFEPVDLILVLSESFWDPTILPGLQYEEDPLPFLHGLDTRGWLLSPVFGGWTCNAEFEILTSLPMAFLPRGAVPYQQYIHRPMPALPQVLRDAGYRTVLLHPHHRWFWRRDAVAPLLGFQEFLSLESYEAIPKESYYSSDRWLTDEVIRTVESSPDQPIFIFAITMQNHGPYEDDRYGPEGGCPLAQSDLPARSRRMLEVYGRGVRDADRMLEKLAEFVRARRRPTLLVFFGDHLPYLGPGHEVYRQSGFVGSTPGLTLPEQYRLHRVPVAYVANFPHEAPPSDISICLLPPWILQQMRREVPVQMRLAEKVRQRVPVLADTWYMDASGVIHEGGSDEALSDYRLLQYDLLFGKQYLLEQSFAGHHP